MNRHKKSLPPLPLYRSVALLADAGDGSHHHGDISKLSQTDIDAAR
jgi:hypothetical protein